MATRIIDDSKLNDIAVAIQAKDSGGQMTVDEMPTRIEALQVADPNEQLIKLFTNTIEYIKVDEPCYIPRSFASGNIQESYSKIEFFSSSQAFGCVENSTFRDAFKLKYANVGLVSRLVQRAFYINTANNLKAIILINSRIVYMDNINVFSQLHFVGYVWVYDSLVEGYKSATNWSAYASQIKGFSEAPTYDSNTTYEIGDVCKYNGKFYGYCKSDLTSSTGNPPTGTTSDNAYWEYVADIEVI